MKLYPYQEQYLADLPPSCIMAADTGTGKTIMALAHYNHLAREGGNAFQPRWPLLVLAPASKVRTGDWEREAEAYFGNDMPDMTVISYEKATRKASGLAHFAKGKVPAWWMQYLAEHPKFVLICDEVHKAKNPQSLTGKGVYALATSANCKQFIGLSATPLPNGWQDAGNYGKIFGWWRNKTEFYEQHVITYRIPGQHWSKITGYRNIDLLQRSWHQRAKSLKKGQALDLPKLVYEVVQTPKPTVYDTVHKTRIYQAAELDNAPKLANGLRRTLIPDRAKWLADFLEGASGHTVIFYNYIEEREFILAAVPKEVAIYRQDGERHEVPHKPDWPTMPERSVTVAQYKSGGTGIEMTYADKLVYMSPTYSYADFMQSVGRVYRAGQSLPVTAYLLHTKDTIDADIWRCVRQKRVFDVELWAKNA